MAGLFKPKMPTPQAPPPVPYVDQSQIDRQTQELARKRKGVAANQLAGDSGPGTVATTMLGGG